jgi:hypothetical protein
VARFAVIALFTLAACESSGGGGTSSGSGSGSAVAQAPVKNPGGGFSADLAKKLDTAGSGNDTAPRTPSSMHSTESEPAAGGSNTDVKSADMKSPSPDTKMADTKSPTPDTKTPDTKTPDTKTPDTKTPDTKVADASKSDTKTADVSTAPKINGAPVMGSTSSKGPVTVSAELKAVNINLLPNWDRDVEGAGTISFIARIPNRQDTATFVFRYGIEDAKAPADRDAYKKWLAENKIFTTRDDRQKGAAWYLEGNDGQGRASFRMVVLYGGKRLICGGTLYKESPLGDLRDQVIIQAKQICESVTL